ncbi:regulatory protein [Rhodotorula sphaerocarpa]
MSPVPVDPYRSQIADEETIRNDYAGQYVQTGARPQNYLRNTDVQTRFAEYPKLAALLEHKHALTAWRRHSVPPTYLNVLDHGSRNTAQTSPPSNRPSLPSPSSSPMSRAVADLAPARFDSILLTPPSGTSFAELAALDLARVAANPGFVWLWVGSGQSRLDLGDGDGGEGADETTGADTTATDGIGLEQGRELLSTWGYRRCEDIVWLKTNKRDPEADLTREPTSLFTPTIEHCLMGIRGTVRRSTDSFLVHCNVDTDVLVWEGDEQDPALKPPELQSLIENFCLGTRRLHLYGSPHSLRRGWLTLSAPTPSFPNDDDPGMYSSDSVVHPVEREDDAAEQRERWGAPRAWTRDEWEARWQKPGVTATLPARAQLEAETSREPRGIVNTLLPFVPEIDALRPKSPPPRDGLPSSGGLGRGRGAGLGVTRSGLVGQASFLPSSPQPPPTGYGYGPGYAYGPGSGGAGRGRGRGRGSLMVRDDALMTPSPMRHDGVLPRMPVSRVPPAHHQHHPQQQQQPPMAYPAQNPYAPQHPNAPFSYLAEPHAVAHYPTPNSVSGAYPAGQGPYPFAPSQSAQPSTAYSPHPPPAQMIQHPYAHQQGYYPGPAQHPQPQQPYSTGYASSAAPYLNSGGFAESGSYLHPQQQYGPYGGRGAPQPQGPPPAPRPNGFPSPRQHPQHPYGADPRLADGLSSVSLHSSPAPAPAPAANGAGNRATNTARGGGGTSEDQLVYPISSRGSTRSRTTSADSSAAGAPGAASSS